MFVVPKKRRMEACEATNLVNLGVREDETLHDDDFSPSTRIKMLVLIPVPCGDFEFIHLDDNWWGQLG